MKSAVRVTAGVFGVVTGFSGLQHWFYEMLQGHVTPAGLMINSYGPPCRPDQVWHACEPAMTLVPDCVWTGLLAMIAGLLVMLWPAAFVQRKSGGAVLALLSVGQLLVGGGLIPPLIGVVAGMVGTRIQGPAPEWPWSLAAFLIWISCQYLVGYLSDVFLQHGILILCLISGPLLLTIAAGFARDLRRMITVTVSTSAAAAGTSVRPCGICRLGISNRFAACAFGVAPARLR